MTAQNGQLGLKLKPRWRIRRPSLSIALCSLVTSALLCASLLTPRTFIASTQWHASSDPLLNQIDHPPLHKLASQILKLPHTANHTNLQFTTLAGLNPGLLITATASSATEAVNRVDQWVSQSTAALTLQLQNQLAICNAQHQSILNEDQLKLQKISRQIKAAQAQVWPTALPTHQVLSEQISQSQKKLEQLTRQQAVYLGANRTLKELYSHRKRLEQDLAMHQQRYGQDDNAPAAKLVTDQLEKIDLRIEIISKASKLGDHADAKIAAVAKALSQARQTITRSLEQQKKRVQHTNAMALINQLRPEHQGLSNQLTYHQQQVDLIDQAQLRQFTWGATQQASLTQARVIWPTLGHVICFALLGGLVTGVVIQLRLRMKDKTLDQSILIEEALGLPVLGHIVLNHDSGVMIWLRRLTVYPLVSVAVMLILCLSLAASYMHLHSITPSTEIWNLLHSPKQAVQSLFNTATNRRGSPIDRPKPLPVAAQINTLIAEQLSDKAS